MGKSGQEQSEQLLEQLSLQICRWRLALPAIVLLQVTRPLSFIASQTLLLCQPLVNAFYEAPQISGYADLLADRANLDRLVARLEEDSRSYRSKERG
jgi:hypothetical protein